MAQRKVVRIDEEKCDGCGECVPSCAEGAIAVIDGKARLVSEVYCDGLGACLGHCPQGAITVEEREAAEFDEAETRKHLAALSRQASRPAPIPLAEPSHQCPGSMARSLGGRAGAQTQSTGPVASELSNWPVQLTLVPPSAPYLRGADLLLVADCVPFAMADFHQRFLRNRPVLIGCPKLDQPEFYAKKLAEIVHTAQPRSLTVIHMEVPCCSGLTRIAQYALTAAESGLALTDVTIGIRGEVLATDQRAPHQPQRV
jgi:NAD-dependent dihydropyrimidine dehydrogenase PreA subunit